MAQPTAREIREGNAREALVDALRASAYGDVLDQYPVELVGDGIRVGDIEVWPGTPRPVIRNAKTKRLMAGSGAHLRKAKEESRSTELAVTAYRDKVEYREAFERLFPAGGDIGDRGSMAYAFDQFWQACEGTPQQVPCPHEGCGKHHVVAFKKDAASLFKMIELGVGKAAQTVNITKKEDRLIQVLSQRVVDVRLFGISDTDAAERRGVIEAAGFHVRLPEGTSATDAIDATYTVVGPEAGNAGSGGGADGGADETR